MNHPPINDNAAALAIAEVVVGANDVVIVADVNANHEEEDDDDDDDEGDDDDNDDGDEDNEDEEEEDDDDEEVIYDPAEGTRICKEAIVILLNRLKFPSPQRDRAIVRFAQQFITNVKEDIHKTITDTRTVEDGYDGLDSERDTDQEVETAIRSCPEVLTQRDDYFGLYPIKCLTIMRGNDGGKLMRNTKAVSFIHLFAKFAIKLNSFEEDERGGLLIEDGTGKNLLHHLVSSSDSSYDADHHHRVDTTFLAVLIRLRQSGYLLQEDIQQYELVHELCLAKCLPEQRFRFLIEWDPPSLLRTNANNELPFHWGAHNIRKFRVVLDAYFRFYPRWNGIKALFTIDNDGETPFLLACELLPRTKVMEAVEEIIFRYTTNNGLLNNSNNNGNAMILAAIDDTISLDGLFFLIRRQPN